MINYLILNCYLKTYTILIVILLEFIVSSLSNVAIKIESVENLTDNLRHLMQLKDISEAALARKTAIPQPTLHKILAGKTNDPRASTLKALADFFEISIDELLTGIAFMQPNTT